MLSKKNRISKKEFPHILNSGKKYNSVSLMLYVALGSNKEKKQSRFSFSVSKKIEKMAVKRNKLRRQGYSIIDRHIKQIKGVNLFFFVFKKGSNYVTFNDLEKEVLGLLSVSSMLT